MLFCNKSFLSPTPCTMSLLNSFDSVHRDWGVEQGHSKMVCISTKNTLLTEIFLLSFEGYFKIMMMVTINNE